jgi:hypothetical protein
LDRDPRHKGMRRRSGGIGKKLDSAKEMAASAHAP